MVYLNNTQKVNNNMTKWYKLKYFKAEVSETAISTNW